MQSTYTTYNVVLYNRFIGFRHGFAYHVSHIALKSQI